MPKKSPKKTPKRSPKKNTEKKSPTKSKKTKKAEPDPIKYITGPVSLSEWKGHGKHIYNFGDRHIRDQTCKKTMKKYMTKDNTLEIDKYIKHVISLNPDKMIDVFLETPWISPEQKVQGASIWDVDEKTKKPIYIAQVEKTFSTCLNVSKSTCPFKNVRFHYVDVRRHKQVKSLVHMYWAVYGLLIAESIEDIKQAVNRFQKVRLGRVLEYTIPTILTQKLKIDKQWNSIKDASLRKNIRDHFTKIFNENEIDGDELQWLYDTFQNPKLVQNGGGLKKEQREKLSKFWDKYEDFFYTVQDAYLAGRLFRTFTKKKSDEYSETPKFAVLYTGEFHKTRYDDLFKRLQMKTIEEVESDDQGDNYQCLDITEFDRPFFYK
jgi:hypothetical protein